MSRFSAGKIRILYGSSGAHLARSVADRLGVKTIDAILPPFKDGETRVRIDESIRDCRVHVINSTHQPDENLTQLIMLGGAVATAKAGRCTAVVPYLGYQRQHRPGHREPNAAAMHLDQIRTIGRFSQLLCFDVHSEDTLATACSSHGWPYDHLYSAQFAVPYILDHMDVGAIVAPDAGGAKRASKWQSLLRKQGKGTRLVTCNKYRNRPNEVDRVDVMGDVEGMNALIVDDMCDTGGTHCAVAKALKEKGADRVYLYAAHGLFSGDALSRIAQSELDKVIVTNSICHSPESLSAAGDTPIVVLDISPLIAAAMRATETSGSISELFLSGNGR